MSMEDVSKKAKKAEYIRISLKQGPSNTFNRYTDLMYINSNVNSNLDYAGESFGERPVNIGNASNRRRWAAEIVNSGIPLTKTFKIKAKSILKTNKYVKLIDDAPVAPDEYPGSDQNVISILSTRNDQNSNEIKLGEKVDTEEEEEEMFQVNEENEAERTLLGEDNHLEEDSFIKKTLITAGLISKVTPLNLERVTASKLQDDLNYVTSERVKYGEIVSQMESDNNSGRHVDLSDYDRNVSLLAHYVNEEILLTNKLENKLLEQDEVIDTIVENDTKEVTSLIKKAEQAIGVKKDQNPRLIGPFKKYLSDYGGPIENLSRENVTALVGYIRNEGGNPAIFRSNIEEIAVGDPTGESPTVDTIDEYLSELLPEPIINLEDSMVQNIPQSGGEVVNPSVIIMPPDANGPKYHLRAITFMYGTIVRPPWDYVLEKLVINYKYSNGEVSDIIDSLIKEYGVKIQVYKRISDGDVIELNEIIQLQYSLERGMRTGNHIQPKQVLVNVLDLQNFDNILKEGTAAITSAKPSDITPMDSVESKLSKTTNAPKYKPTIAPKSLAAPRIVVKDYKGFTVADRDVLQAANIPRRILQDNILKINRG